MENKINIAEILKECPMDIRLYSPIFGECTLIGVGGCMITVLCCATAIRYTFYSDGTYVKNGECMLFPSKEQRDWSKFHRPFVNGDIVADKHGNIAIYKGTMWYNKKLADYYCGYRKSDNHFLPEPKRDGHFGFIEEIHYAMKEEKQKLFEVIKDNGYKWNAESKALEKLIMPKFKVGNIIQDKGGYKVKITEINIEDECYGYESMIAKGIGGITFENQDDWELVEQKFKVGDRVRRRYTGETYIIDRINSNGYLFKNEGGIGFTFQDDWLYELLPNKFDISSLKPFDKVLVRNTNNGRWCGQFYMDYDKNEDYPFECTYDCWMQCIPYEGNEHLRGTTNDCDDFYKNW